MNCVECNKPVISIPLITGIPLELWCNDHLAAPCAISISRLGRQTHDVIFSVIEHNVWFWERDIRYALQAALDTFFEEIARDPYNTATTEWGLEELIRVKAKELMGIIEFSQQEEPTIKKILQVWLTPGYISDIKGPLGKDTADFIGKISRGFISPAMAEILTCMTLAAKRAASYEEYDNSAVLIKIEQDIWKEHRITIGGLDG